MYQVSDQGRFRSLKFGKCKLIKPGKTRCGYLNIFTCTNGVKTRHIFHRVIWNTFKGEIPEKMDIDHLNGIKTDNRLINLDVVTHQENVQRAMNRKRVSGRSSSIYQGVTLFKGVYYEAYCSINGRSRHIGYYKCEQDARCVAELAREGVYPPRLQKRLEKQKNKNV